MSRGVVAARGPPHLVRLRGATAAGRGARTGAALLIRLQNG
ncbi:MAG: hypothetical protein ACRDND_14635 [Streptosporangiaceae bacterium]